MDVPKLLNGLFELQRFDPEPALQSLIDETERRYQGTELPDDALGTLSAAGEPHTHLSDAKKRNGNP